MLQNPCKTLGFKKNMVYKIPPWGGGKPYPASGLYSEKLSDIKDLEKCEVYSKKKANIAFALALTCVKKGPQLE